MAFGLKLFAFLFGVASMSVRVSSIVGQTQRKRRSSNNVILFVLLHYEMSRELNSYFCQLADGKTGFVIHCFTWREILTTKVRACCTENDIYPNLILFCTRRIFGERFCPTDYCVKEVSII